MNVPGTIAIKLNKAAEKAVKLGHPWIFEQSIEKGGNVNDVSGSLCVIFDQRTNRPFAFGLWDADEIIRIKIIYKGSRLKLDEVFWNSQIKKAHELRKELIENGVTGYRAIHGENDGFPGLVLDVYLKTGVLKIYAKIWKPYIERIIGIIKTQFELDNIVIRFSRKILQTNSYPYEEGQVVGQELTSEKVVFEEYGVKFIAYTQSGHKTGFFLDQRPNRYWVQQNAQGKKVLDVFSYVGGFGIHALKGNAESLTSIDISTQAMDVALENIKLNGLKESRWTPIAADAFAALNDLIAKNEKFDIVILDPPSFAKQQSEIAMALKQYERLANIGKDLVSDHGYLILGSCSSRITLEDFRRVHQTGFRNERNNFHIIDEVLHDVDHPITFEESNYLKTIIYQKR